MRIVPIVMAFAVALPAAGLGQDQKPSRDYLQPGLNPRVEFRCDSLVASDCFAILAHRTGNEKAEPDKFCDKFPKACVRLLDDTKSNERH